MSTKTISIKEEAYNRLYSKKKENESFSDVIFRLTGKGSILRFAGIWKDEEADKVEKAIKEGRALSRKRMERSHHDTGH